MKVYTSLKEVHPIKALTEVTTSNEGFRFRQAIEIGSQFSMGQIERLARLPSENNKGEYRSTGVVVERDLGFSTKKRLSEKNALQ